MALRKRQGKRRKQCFVIQQMGKPGSEQRKHANAVLNSIIRPAAIERGYAARRVDELSQVGRISEDIVEALGSAHLVIADLNGLNPNVMYELGIRDAWNLRVVLLAPAVEGLPFDIRDINTIPYGDPAVKSQVRSAKAELKRRIRATDMKPGTPRVFVDTFANVRKPFEMHPIRRAAHSAVRDLIGSLRNCIVEVEKETDRVSDDAFLHLATLVSDPFKSLRDKKHVLADIAEDAKDQALAERLRSLGQLAEMGNQVITLLKEGARTPETLRKVQEKLEKIKKRAQGFADEFDSP